MLELTSGISKRILIKKIEKHLGVYEYLHVALHTIHRENLTSLWAKVTVLQREFTNSGIFHYPFPLQLWKWFRFHGGNERES